MARLTGPVKKNAPPEGGAFGVYGMIQRDRRAVQRYRRHCGSRITATRTDREASAVFSINRKNQYRRIDKRSTNKYYIDNTRMYLARNTIKDSMNAESEWTDVCLRVFDLFFKVNGVTVPGREIPVTLNPAAIDEENRFFCFDGSDGLGNVAKYMQTRLTSRIVYRIFES